MVKFKKLVVFEPRVLSMLNLLTSSDSERNVKVTKQNNMAPWVSLKLPVVTQSNVVWQVRLIADNLLGRVKLNQRLFVSPLLVKKAT